MSWPYENERKRVVEIARSWLGTPYHDCACIKGHGVDCAYLLKAVFEEAGLEAPIDVPTYSPQWFLHRDAELYLNTVMDRAIEIDEAESLPGDVVLYQIGRCFAHGAIIVDPGFPVIIHAYKQAACVCLGEGNGGDLAQIADGKPRPRRFFTRKDWR